MVILGAQISGRGGGKNSTATRFFSGTALKWVIYDSWWQQPVKLWPSNSSHINKVRCQHSTVTCNGHNGMTTFGKERKVQRLNVQFKSWLNQLSLSHLWCDGKKAEDTWSRVWAGMVPGELHLLLEDLNHVRMQSGTGKKHICFSFQIVFNKSLRHQVHRQALNTPGMHWQWGSFPDQPLSGLKRLLCGYLGKLKEIREGMKTGKKGERIPPKINPSLWISTNQHI